jgi:chemotaxis protein CheX
MESFEVTENELGLPPVLDLVAAPILLEAFLGWRGRKLAVDGRGVQRLGAQCLQILLAARAAWAADDQELVVENCSEDFLAALDLLGVAPKTLTYRSLAQSKELAE